MSNGKQHVVVHAAWWRYAFWTTVILGPIALGLCHAAQG